MNSQTESSGGTGTAPPPTAERWRPKANPWLIAVVVSMAAFMEFLDTSIANVALPYMAGNLGASNDESTWILTSYLASNAIVLPLAGWFAGSLGRKRFFLICLAIFTLSSLLCGIAPNLGAIILFRALQGAGGGGLQPMAQAILADTFPPQQRGLAFAVFGVTAVVAPTIGPTLGGWITDNYSWRWIFFINLPVGIFALLLIYRLIEDPPWAKRAAGAVMKFDYLGIGLLALGVAALQVMLDKGQEDDWFGSRFILTLAVVAGVCLVSLVVWEWFHKAPIVDVRLFKNFNFLSANAMMFVLGILLFAALVMMPQFLQTLVGYTSTLAGLVLSGGGVLLLFLMPLMGVLTSKIQARYIIGFGWLALSLAMYYSTQQLHLQISFRTASILRVVQVFGIGFLFVPITMVSYVGMPVEKSNSIAGLLNFMRNIGSSIGTSMVTTLIARRSQVHQAYLVTHVTPGSPIFAQAIHALAARLVIAGFDATTATHQALGRIYRATIAQAATLAYIDTFSILSTGAAIMFLLSFTLKRNQPGGGEVAVG
ncbi:MAG TPA: DHA2 family efflux MFS transporter permease subunit [Candidatus Dormibacteraeota bacterium]|jgi:DHA2 family multidrug resistance protein|nr:DHA2 family efflux MFS transporter permease subunit [Candidatus Dormibacteraeota bacterium]